MRCHSRGGFILSSASCSETIPNCFAAMASPHSAYRGFDSPAAVFENTSRNSVASGWSPVGSHNLKFSLAPGEGKSFIFVLGYCENPQDQKFTAQDVINKAPAEKLLAMFRTDAQFDKAFDERQSPHKL